MKEFFSGLFSSWKFWVVVALIIAAIFLFNAGVTKGVNTPPDDAPYPSEGQTQVQQTVFQEWAKTDGNAITEDAYSYFSSWYNGIWYGQMRDLMDKMTNLTDSQIIWINNNYNRKYYKSGTFLKQVRDHKLYGVIGEATSYNNVLARLIKNGAK